MLFLRLIEVCGTGDEDLETVEDGAGEATPVVWTLEWQELAVRTKKIAIRTIAAIAPVNGSLLLSETLFILVASLKIIE